MEDKANLIYDNTVISSRIRFARNLSGYPFPGENLSVKDAGEIISRVSKELIKTGEYKIFQMKALHPVEIQVLKEKYLVSTDLMEKKDVGAVMLSDDEAVAVMINEEDHLREQCILKGFKLREAYERIDLIDDALSKNLGFAFDSDFGFLTRCATNLGTGMRASVMMFLPAITMSGAAADLFADVKKLGLTVRGAFGEGSDAEGYVYQISNQVSLGVSEAEILTNVEFTVKTLADIEKKQREIIYDGDPVKMQDRCRRAYGILTNAALLSSKEFSSLIADVKLGCSYGILKLENPESLDDLEVTMRPAHINMMAREELSYEERDFFRAEYVGKTLRKMGGLNV